MAAVVSFLSLLGVWLVLAGAIYQSNLELRAEVTAREIFEAGHKLPRPPSVSAWWWLLPPVYVVLSSMRMARARDAYLGTLTTAELTTLVAYSNKAAGWQLVGLGGFLVALQQTHQFAHEHARGEALFVALVIGSTIVSVRFARLLLRRGDAYLRGREGR